MRCEDYKNQEFLDILDFITEDEIVMANKIYELSEKLEKLLFKEASDAPDCIRSEVMKALDANIELTLSETVSKESSSVSRLERILAQNRTENPTYARDIFKT